MPNRKLANQKGLAPVVILIIVTVIVGIAFIAGQGYENYKSTIYQLNHPSPSTPTQPSQQITQSNAPQSNNSDLKTPEGIVAKLYNDHLTCSDETNRGIDKEKWQSWQDCVDLIKQYTIKNESFELSCGAQNRPAKEGIKIDKAKINGSNATVTAHQYWGDGQDTPAVVELKLIDGQWKIASLTCQKMATKNLKTYKNDTFGFEFQYDADSKIVYEVENGHAYIEGEDKGPYPDKDLGVVLKLDSDDLWVTRDGQGYRDDVSYFTLEIVKDCTGFLGDNPRQKVINGLTFQENEFNITIQGGKDLRRSACVNHSGKIWNLINDTHYQENGYKTAYLYYQILNSFKFNN